MIRLIHNEIVKLINKKSFYIVTIIFILFCILTNIIYKTPLNSDVEEKINIEELKQENLTFDLDSEEDLIKYVDNLTTIKIEELKSIYSDTVSNYIINHFMYSDIYDYYEQQYILEDENLANDTKRQIDLEIKYLENHDWQYFLDERINYLENRVKNTSGIEQERYEKLLEIANYRKQENIVYDSNNYLHRSLEFIEENTYEYVNLLHDDDLTEEEVSRLDYLNEEMAIHEYVLKNKQDVLNEHTLRAVFMNFPGEFGLFILIYTIMIAGSIVSEEYSRGTIKTLLVAPYKRITILTSKLLTVLILIPVVIIFMCLFELLIGGIIIGFDSLSIPVLINSLGVIKTYSVINYLVMLLLANLPVYLIIALFAFTLSVVTTSTSAAITLSFLFYLMVNILANLANIYNFPIFKACVALYWDFSYLVLGIKQPFGASLGLSIMVLFIYIVIMLCISYVIFQNKDVKNC